MSTGNDWVDGIISKTFTDTYTPLHQEGPDYIIPTEDQRTWRIDGTTKLDIPPDVTPFWKPESIVTFMKKTVDKYPDNYALAVKKDDHWVKWTYQEYWNDVRTAAKAFIKLGLTPNHGLCLLGFNAPEWHISHLASIFAGGIAVGVYTTNSSEACLHILNDSSIQIAVVENETQLNKILLIKDSLPQLKTIIQYTGTPTRKDVFSWSDLMAIGKSVPEDVLDQRIRGLSINQCCCLIYTSGTTGNSKGVMMSHDNILCIVKFFCSVIWKHVEGKEVGITYLPLSHVAAMSCDIYGAIQSAALMYFATPDALKGKLVETLTEAQPTAFLAVPRVYEKIYEKLQEVEVQMSGAKRGLLKWARKQGLKYHLKPKQNGSTTLPVGFVLAKKLIYQKVKKGLGMHRTRLFMCGGAPLSSEVQRYFLGFDIPICEGYGLSESAGPHVMNKKSDIRIGYVGKVGLLPELETKIDTQNENGEGEILLRGRNIFMGYLHMENDTLGTIDANRYMHTGDTGIIDDNGFLKITGRIKELLITSGGENIPPVPIEEAVKKFLPIVSNCMLIGDKRKYLAMIITLKSEIDLDTLIPMDRLTSVAIKWCQSVGSKAERVTDIVQGQDDKVLTAIQDGIDRYNKEAAMSNAQRIQKWKILNDDFSLPGGELGPTAKLKRPIIMEKYAEIIESMY